MGHPVYVFHALEVVTSYMFFFIKPPNVEKKKNVLNFQYVIAVKLDFLIVFHLSRLDQCIFYI